jgi:hypothetical protein
MKLELSGITLGQASSPSTYIVNRLANFGQSVRTLLSRFALKNKEKINEEIFAAAPCRMRVLESLDENPTWGVLEICASPDDNWDTSTRRARASFNLDDSGFVLSGSGGEDPVAYLEAQIGRLFSKVKK